MLVLGLVLILIGCDVFTNSIEWLGKKLNLNEGLLGSIFAAVGTALPETLIPIVAVILGATSSTGMSRIPASRPSRRTWRIFRLSISLARTTTLPCQSLLCRYSPDWA